MNQDTIAELRELFTQFDATLARVCTILNRAEARVDAYIEPPKVFPPGLPPLPEPPPGMRWGYADQGTGERKPNIYAFKGWAGWLESDKLSVVPDIHYAVPVPI
jgi:hypothetical protein